MSPRHHPEIVALIEKSVWGGRISPEEQRRMRDHVRACEACRRVYDHHVRSERALGASPDRPLSLGQRSRVSERLFEGNGGPRNPVMAAWAVAGAMAVAGMALVVLPPGGGQETLQSRGSLTEEAPSIEVSLRVLRIRDHGGEAIIADVGEDGEVSQGDRLALVYTNLGDYNRVDVIRRHGDEEQQLAVSTIEPGVVDGRLSVIDLTQGWPRGSSIIEARFLAPDGSSAVRKVRLKWLEP